MLLYYFNFIFTYSIASIFTFIMDLNQKENNYKDKIQHKKMKEIFDIMNNTFVTVFKNVFIYSIPFIFIMSQFININNNDFTLVSTIYNFIACYYLTDFFFYIFHRILHLPLFYKYHKKHHELKSPIGLSALYMGVVDYYINLTSIALPLIILSCHSYFVHLWIFMSIISTVCVSHSGYKNLSEVHDIHHKYFKYNYGVGGLMDKLCGTYYDK